MVRGERTSELTAHECRAHQPHEGIRKGHYATTIVHHHIPGPLFCDITPNRKSIGSATVITT